MLLMVGSDFRVQSGDGVGSLLFELRDLLEVRKRERIDLSRVLLLKVS
jgi:hypothetical protein